jgi:hypothetical protein
MTFYVGLVGTKGVGKSTLAGYLKDELPDAAIIAFADALRADVVAMLGDVYDGIPLLPWLEERKATIFGPILQGVGEFGRQSFGDDYWIKRLADAAHCQDVVIVPDVRYVNEAEWIKAQGGLLVSVVGPPRWEGDQRDPSHPSEAAVPDCQRLADVQARNIHGRGYLMGQARMIANRVRKETGP